ncbi:hypothetical protein ASE16_15825 [Leifsonia sp. Root227]|nr:hypothetical protein ASE16_15825 [Leifsonia sp. Root227]
MTALTDVTSYYPIRRRVLIRTTAARNTRNAATMTSGSHHGVSVVICTVSSHDRPLGGVVAQDAQRMSGDDVSMSTACQGMVP